MAGLHVHSLPALVGRWPTRYDQTLMERRRANESRANKLPTEPVLNTEAAVKSS